jgi:hypothetical protein
MPAIILRFDFGEGKPFSQCFAAHCSISIDEKNVISRLVCSSEGLIVLKFMTPQWCRGFVLPSAVNSWCHLQISPIYHTS